jgi:D-sedoheptulose 7-phosphate isomerase
MPETAGSTVAADALSARASLAELARLASDTSALLGDLVDRAGEAVGQCLLAGGRVLACGNGGSAADAQHFVAELVGHMCVERRALPAVALASDPSIVTAIANDYGYDRVFARQVEAHGQPGDVLIVLSTSGKSPNVLRALEAARAAGMVTIALVGSHVEPAVGASDVCLPVPSRSTPRIQEIHMALLHAICEQAEAVVMAGGQRS